MLQERSAVHVLLSTSTVKRLRDWPRTRWRDYVSDLPWSCLGVEPAGLSAETVRYFATPGAAAPATLLRGKGDMRMNERFSFLSLFGAALQLSKCFWWVASSHKLYITCTDSDENSMFAVFVEAGQTNEAKHALCQPPFPTTPPPFFLARPTSLLMCTSWCICGWISINFMPGSWFWKKSKTVNVFRFLDTFYCTYKNSLPLSDRKVLCAIHSAVKTRLDLTHTTKSSCWGVGRKVWHDSTTGRGQAKISPESRIF